ncbi:hypothetical protein F5Y10DRAFT_276686 [Nemania abortiva]|nr:hypothetical protein F5Y10DRAFT_276686 [Nemania abortiva]
MADTQPGLEVVVHPVDPEVAPRYRPTLQNSHTRLDTAPEVVPIEYYRGQSHRPEAIHAFGKSERELISGSSEERSYGSADFTPKFLKGRRRRLILIAFGIFSLIVVVAVASGVVGSRRGDSVSSTATSGAPTSSFSSPTSTATSTSTSPHPLQPNAGLAVAGWRKQNEFISFRVFYQDPDNGLQFSEYNSDGAGWGNSTNVNREEILSNTSIGATVILTENPPQYELFFLNTSSLVTGNNFRDRVTEISGNFDSIDGHPILAHSKSRLIACWPYIVLQKPNRTLSVVNWLGREPMPWQNYSLGIGASEGTSLAILPLSRTYEAPYRVALVYRGPDGVLALHSLEYGATGSELQTVEIARSYSSSFGAFAVARENDPSNGTNIYILYQSESNDLEYVYNRGDSWELGESSDVLKNADPSTDITCLTESIWDGLAVMSSKYDMSRCFFYSGGRIKQVQFNGTTWVGAETIPYT